MYVFTYVCMHVLIQCILNRQHLSYTSLSLSVAMYEVPYIGRISPLPLPLSLSFSVSEEWNFDPQPQPRGIY